MARASIAFALVLALAAQVALSNPTNWSGKRSHDGCVLPEAMQGGHADPEVDSAINIKVIDALRQQEVSSYTPGKTYVVEVSPSAASMGLLLNSAGTFGADPENAACGETGTCCEVPGKRYTWTSVAAVHQAGWTAPSAGTGDVTFSTVFASGFSAAYKTSGATISEAASGGMTGSSSTTRAPTSAPATAPVAGSTSAPVAGATPAPVAAPAPTPAPIADEGTTTTSSASSIIATLAAAVVCAALALLV